MGSISRRGLRVVAPVLGILSAIAGTPAIGGITESVNAVLDGTPLIVRGDDGGGSLAEAVAIRAHMAIEGVDVPHVEASDAVDERLAAHDLLVFGTPANNPLIRRCLEDLPFRIDATSLSVGDSTYSGTDFRLVVARPHPLDPEKNCVFYVTQDEEYLPGVFFGFGASFSNTDFVAYRKSDGMFYSEDRLALGDLSEEGGAHRVVNAAYFSKPPAELTRLDRGTVRLRYNGLTESEAETLSEYVDALCGISSRQFGIEMPNPVHVYFYENRVEETRIAMYTDAWNTFWRKLSYPKEEFFASEVAPVAFAHEVSRLVFQPIHTDSLKQGPLRFYNDDWSHYFQHKVLVPRVWQELGEGGWPVENNYAETWGASKFDRLYSGAEDTYAYLLYEIESRYGRELVGRVVNEVTHNGARRQVGIEGFMETLAAATEDPEIIERVAAALPTSLEYSLDRRMESFGFLPRIEEMVGSHEFVVTEIADGSEAASEGIRVGDELFAINGSSLQTQKAHAHRSVLAAIQSGDDLILEWKRGDEHRRTVLSIVVRG